MRNKIIPYRTDLKDKARKLRLDSTYGEVMLWLEIKNRQLGFQFHRQVPMLDYIVDFYCHELMLAIEIDGDSHSTDEAKKYDLARQGRLETHGVKFLRFDDDDVRGDINKVVGEIRQWIVERGLHDVTPPLPPSPQESFGQGGIKVMPMKRVAGNSVKEQFDNSSEA